MLNSSITQMNLQWKALLKRLELIRHRLSRLDGCFSWRESCFEFKLAHSLTASVRTI